MTNRLRKSLIYVLFTLLIACATMFMVSGMSVTFAEGYQGLTGNNVQEEVTAKVTLEDFKIESSAIRIEKPYGIRFITSISDADLDKLPDNAQFGTIVVPTKFVSGDLTFDTASAKIAYAVNYSRTKADTGYQYVVAVVGEETEGEFADLAVDFYGMDFTARSFVTYTLADQTPVTTYTQPLSAKPQSIANSTLAESEDGDYDEDQITLLKAVAAEEDKIGYFDTAYGAKQLSSTIANVSYTTDVKYESEQGSTMIEWTSNPVGNTLTVTLKDMILKDVSNYEFIDLYVYNPNEFAITFKFYIWFGYTTLNPGKWTAIRFSVSEITAGGTVGNPDITSLEDVTGLSVVCNCGDDYDLTNAIIYLSSMKAYVKPEAVADKIGYFDNPYGTYQITTGYPGGTGTNTTKATIGYTTEKAYGDEAGSLKITYTTKEDGHGQTFHFNANTLLTNLTGYDYIKFYVYTETANTKFKFHNITTRFITANEWFEVKVDIATLVSSASYVTKDTTNGTITNVTGLVFDFHNMTTNVGATFYVSAVYAGKNA